MKNRLSRLSIFTLITVLVSGVFTVRLFQLQVLSGSYYREQALETQLKKFEIPASRGEIYFKDGANATAPLALNSAVATVAVDPSFIDEDDRAEVASELSRLLDKTVNEIDDILSDSSSSYEVLQRRVPERTATAIRDAGLKGVIVKDTEVRVYPEQTTAAHVLGFVDGNELGQYGIEQYFDDRLSGQDGQLRAITDINGVPLPVNEDNIETPPQKGDDLTLTIDRSVQQYSEQKLVEHLERTGGVQGSVIVMDPHTGRVVAMANAPTYDPATYFDVDDVDIFTNNVIAGAYETGSGIKSFTMAMGLAEGAVGPESVFYDSGQRYIDGYSITNADSSGGFDRTMTEIIQKSVNTGVVHVLEQVGDGTINDQARRTMYDYFTNKFGFGSPTGITLSGEVGGTVIDPDSYEGSAIRYANMSFGQGMTVTMLQMAAGYSALVNGGDYYKPTIVESISHADGTVEVVEPTLLRQSVIPADVSETLQAMMYSVVEAGGGYTARRSGYDVGGKTGTAQIPDDQGGYAEGRYIGSFTGFGATADGEYIVMTRIDEPTIDGYAGSVAAAPLFADISNFLIDYYQLTPDGGNNE